MKGKGIIQFFAIALFLVSIYQLSFNFVTRGVEKRGKEYAERKATGGKSLESIGHNDSIQTVYKRFYNAYIDSMQNEEVYPVAGFTYQRCKEQQLNLGLDLQGGMNVVLQVSMRDLIASLADHSKDPSFVKSLDAADIKQQTESQKDYVTLFIQSYKEVNPTGKLASVFATKDNAERIQYNSTDQEVEKVIREEATNAFNRTFNILRSRIDKFGVASPGITSDPGTGRVTVELPGVDNPNRVRKLLQASAKLEFWETYTAAQIYPVLENVNAVLAQRLSPTDSSKAGSNPLASTDSTASTNPLATNDSAKATSTNPLAAKDSNALNNATATAPTDTAAMIAKQQAENPLYSVLIVSTYKDDTDGKMKVGEGPTVGYVLGKDTSKLNAYLTYDFVRVAVPRDVKFVYSAKPVQPFTNGLWYYELYSLKKQGTSDEAPLDGSMIVSARNDVNQNNQVEVGMNMNPDGAKIWRLLTQKQVNKYGPGKNGFIAITLDDQVQSAPRVNEEIPNGRSSISGSFTQEEAKDLANILQAGKLPAPARIIAENVVGPSLGAESVKRGITSMILAFVAILFFMIVYYNTSGIVANIALLFNLLFIVGILASISATLTLPGIAGIVLTMGMAVDANVLIHERIKEELRKGSSMVKAVHDGHTKSYSAIFDSNITTLITGIILAYFGLGPVLGYAVTLNIGIIMTLFTAVFLAHILMDWWIKRGFPIKFSTSVSRDFTHYNFQFVKNRKYAYMFSAALSIVALVSIFTKGFEYGVDFKGGRSFVVQMPQEVSTTDIRNDLTTTFGAAPVVKTYGTGNNQYKITTAFMAETMTSVADSQANHALFQGLKKYYGAAVSFGQFNSQYKLSSSIVGPTISDDIKNGALKAILLSLLAIGLYIFVRFRKWQYSLGAIISLAHDTLIVMGVFSLLEGVVPFSLELDEQFVAAVLTVIGYSMNDTVIVYDRIREYLAEHPAMDMKKVINDALNATLNRTITTHVTVLIVLLVLFFFGGESVRGFTFAMIIGVVFGVYSSIYIATPVVIDMIKDDRKLRFDAPKAGTSAPKQSVAKN